MLFWPLFCLSTCLGFNLSLFVFLNLISALSFSACLGRFFFVSSPGDKISKTSGELGALIQASFDLVKLLQTFLFKVLKTGTAENFVEAGDGCSAKAFGLWPKGDEGEIYNKVVVMIT